MLAAVTLSDEQGHAIAHPSGPRPRASTGQVHFEIRDYRSLQERFDSIRLGGHVRAVGVLTTTPQLRNQQPGLLKPDGGCSCTPIGR